MTRERFYNGCDKVIRFSFYAVIYFMPISVALIELFTFLALITFFVKRGMRFYFAIREELRAPKAGFLPHVSGLFLRSFKPVSSPLNVPIGSYILANSFSVIFSQYVCQSFKAFFYKLLQSTYVVFTFLEGMKTKGHLRVFITVFMVSAGLISASGICQYVTGKDFIHGHALMGKRVVASFKHPNDFGTYLVVVVPVLVSLIFFWIKNIIVPMITKKRAVSRQILLFILLIVILIMALTCLGLTLSRGAWMATFVALLFLGLQYRKIIPVFFVAVVLFSLVFLPRLEKIRNVSFVSDDVKIQRRDLARMTGTEDVSFFNYSKFYFKSMENFEGMGRGEFWREAWKVVRAYPVLGSGLNTYSRIVSDGRANAGGYPHNCFLQMAAEIGMVGLAVFLWIIGAAYRNFFRAVFTCTDPFLKDLSFGFMAALTGYLIHSFLDTNLYSVQLGNLFWILLAVTTILPKAENPR